MSSTATAEAVEQRKVTVHHPGYGITLTLDRRDERRYGYWTQYSGYVRNPKKNTPDGPSVAFVFPQGESVMGNLMQRHDRPWQVWKPMVEHALRDAGVRFERLAWRQRYYCDCPCSPGFIIVGGSGPGYDYVFTVE